MANLPENTAAVIHATREWLEKAVIGLHLCPFAKSVFVKGQIRWIVSEARTPEELLRDLQTELHTLHTTAPEQVDTTLLIHPYVLADFLDYNEFLAEAEAVLDAAGLVGEIQIASFHPHYQFADTAPDDISNYTNRSPFPTLHLLREDSVTRAVEAFPETEKIFAANIETMQQLGHEGWKKLGLHGSENSSSATP